MKKQYSQYVVLFSSIVLSINIAFYTIIPQLPYFGWELMKNSGIYGPLSLFIFSMIIGSVCTFIDAKNESRLELMHTQSKYAMIEHLEEYFKNRHFPAALRFGRCLSRALWTGGRYEERIRLGRIMFEASSVERNKEVQVLALIDDLGWTNVMLKNYDEAKKNINSGLKIAEDMKDFYLIAKATRHLGGIATKLSRHDDAEKILLAAEEIAKNITEEKRQKEMIAGIQYGLAELYLDMGKINKAELACDKAQKLFEEINDKERLIMRHSRFGRIFLDKKMNNEAISTFSEGLELARKANMDDEIVRNLIGISKAYLIDGRWYDAKTDLEEAYKIAESIGMENEKDEARNLLQKNQMRLKESHSRREE